MFLTVSELVNTPCKITIQDLTAPIEFIDICAQVRSTYHHLFISCIRADLNALKDSISYLNASDRDCIEASLSVLFPVNKSS